MGSDTSRAILITGCSSGIGRATALHLVSRGRKVYATARNPAALSDLERAGCLVLPLDITDEASMVTAVATVERQEGAVGVLINNAGYSQGGAIESVSMELVRRQFETNVFGLARLTQLVLPQMRRQRWGKIVNIGSMGGRLAFPGAGYYHATKYALEALTDVLRFEVAGFGIDTILIEPGLIRTGFSEAAVRSMGQSVPSDNPYRDLEDQNARSTHDAYVRAPLSWLGGNPQTVAVTIEGAITSRRPRARYTVTPSARLFITLRRVVPDRVWDLVLRSSYPQPH